MSDYVSWERYYTDDGEIYIHVWNRGTYKYCIYYDIITIHTIEELPYKKLLAYEQRD